eukprot:GEZU01016536.1.p1 GENE.GEZU01016536.1~~GEZU01016536.1.p1  ORF type:complete len:176 (+),score=50.01 GEZU01016536.1:358-885(+)
MVSESNSKDTPVTITKKKMQSKISFAPVTDKNVDQLKSLNAAIFPVTYPEKFYSNLLVAGEEFSSLAVYNDTIIGAVCSRIEPKPTGGSKLYIMTLGVLAPYRQLGIGTRLLQRMMDLAKKHPSIDEIYLHVQTTNTEGIQFYKKHGFAIKEEIRNYYKRIENPHCYLLEKKLRS